MARNWETVSTGKNDKADCFNVTLFATCVVETSVGMSPSAHRCLRGLVGRVTWRGCDGLKKMCMIIGFVALRFDRMQ